MLHLMARRRFLTAALLLAAPLTALPAQAPAASQPQGPTWDAVREGRKLANQGKLGDALAEYAKALQLDPKMYEANLSSGAALDLLGRYAEARTFLQTAVDVAKPEVRGTPLRNMAFSYAFEKDCANAVKYAKQAYEVELAKPDMNGAAEVANELGRICLESEDVKVAAEWYQKGYDAAMKQPVLPDSAKDLWNFRWHNALARIAARKGDKTAALMHVGHAKGFLDKGTNPGQAAFMPYLSGYVAFFTGDMAAALTDLKQAQQNDPFILALMAQAYEKTGDRAAAMELWKKIMTINNHNPTNAFARPMARKRVG